MALGAMLVLSSATACGDLGDENDGLSSEEWKAAQDMQPLATAMPRNPFNHLDEDDAVAKFGQMMFPEYGYAEALTVAGPAGMVGEKGKISCLTCHDPNHGYADPRPVSFGRNGAGKRNTPTMVNVGYYNWAGWTGKHDSLVMHGSGVMGSAGTPLYYSHFIYAKYKDEYNAAFPTTPLDPALDAAAPDASRFPPSGGPKANAMAADGPWEKMTPEDRRVIQQVQYNMGRTWDTYPRKLLSRNSPFERYVRDRDFSALSPSAKAGLKLFIGKAACNDCHTGPVLADNSWHNIGVSDPPGATTQDQGRFPDMATTPTNVFSGAGEFSDDRAAGMAKHATMPIGDETMKGAFRTPMLLNIAATGPYFHTGLAATLDDVVHHYNKGGGEAGTFAGTKDPRIKPLGLSDKEMSDLVEFLKSLTGDAPDPAWTANISKP